MTRILYIVNPASAGGLGQAAWERFRACWGADIAEGDIMLTQGPGDAERLAESCQGYDIIVGVSGDGTLGEIATGLMRREGPHPKLAPVPGGAGNDVCRAVGILTIDDAVQALRRGTSRPYDLIEVACEHDGVARKRHVLMFANAGFSSGNQAKPWMKRFLGATVTYYLAMVLELFAHKRLNIRVTGGGRDWSGPAFMVIAANVEASGGGSVRLGPGAKTDDGLLEVTIVPDRSKLKMLLQVLPKVSSGAFAKLPGFECFQAAELRIDSDPATYLEIDGDTYGSTPATLTVCPGALQIVC